MTWHRKALAGILVLSAAARLWIALRGGQFYWPDEGRYDSSREAVGFLFHGQFRAFLQGIFGHADHVLFGIIGLIPATAEHWGAAPWMAAAFFGAFSTGGIYVIWRISLETSGDEEEALIAAAVAAGSASLLYFSRHYFPYDLSLFFALCGLRSGLRGPGDRAGFRAGLWSSLAFLTYNGYWLLCAVGMLIGVVRRPRSPGPALRRAGMMAAGFALPVLGIWALERAVGVDFFRRLADFSTTVTLGDYDEGWSFVWKYLWAGERWLVVLWAASALGACGLALAGRRRHLLWWVLGGGLIYLGLAGMCIGLEKFVIYGRIARCLVPFFAWLTAGCLAAIGGWGRRGRWWQALLLIAIGIQVARNFTPVLTQVFPAEFQRLALRRGQSRPLAPGETLRLSNAYFFHYAQFTRLPGRYRVIVSARHPLEYRPYLYEGYGPDERARFATHDLTMRLMAIPRGEGGGLARQPDPILEGYPGPVSLTLMLPKVRGLLGEPLLTTGESTRGDFIYVDCFPGRGIIRVALDHWGGGGPETGDIPVDFGKSHRFDLSIGSLFPPEASDLYRSRPAFLPLVHRLFIRLDGRVIVDQKADFYPAGPAEITLAANAIGGSTANPSFSGAVIREEPMDPAGIPAEGSGNRSAPGSP